ncbi:MAG: PQQ-binding-like beta-propeller repeat protein, partial [Planctomycetes bacterium]|nr:PQQ-binding-like beta-propeller repeat protein [Planctomycetota bacterium]
MPAHPIARLISLFAFVGLAGCAGAPDCAGPSWPQGAGPNGDWTADGPPPPLTFSGTNGENVLWRTPLPETGQGGIAIANGRCFVATMAPWTGEGLSAADAERYAHAIEKRQVVGKHIDAHCLDADTGEVLWTRRIEGSVPSIYSYPFSDATSASPCADDEHVWFTNAGGAVVCYTHDGDEVWRRTFTPTFDGPFNKQFEPFLVADPARGDDAKTLVHMEPLRTGAPDQNGRAGPRWHFLLGLDARTGAELWRSDDALTHYNAPTLVATADGPCALHARGGPHQVPERPVGLSLTRLTGPRAGARVWRYDDPRDNHEASLQTMAADDRFAYWLLKQPRNLLVVLDVPTGEVRGEISLTKNVSLREAPAGGVGDGPTEPRVTTLDQGVFPMRYSMHAANGRLFFLCYAKAWGKPTLGAPWCVASVDPDPDTDRSPVVFYRELPTSRAADGTLRWRETLRAKAVNSRGEEVTGDDRSRWDG